MADDEILIRMRLDQEQFRRDIQGVPAYVKSSLGRIDNSAYLDFSSGIKKTKAEWETLNETIRKNPARAWAEASNKAFKEAQQGLQPFIQQLDRLGVEGMKSMNPQGFRDMVKYAQEAGVELKTLTRYQRDMAAATRQWENEVVAADERMAESANRLSDVYLRRMQKVEAERRKTMYWDRNTHMEAQTYNRMGDRAFRQKYGDLYTSDLFERGQKLNVPINGQLTGLEDQIRQTKELKQQYSGIFSEMSRLGKQDFSKVYGAAALTQAIQLHDEYNVKIKSTKGTFDSFITSTVASFGRHLAQWSLYLVAIDAATEAIQAYHEAINEASETQVQQVLFNAAQRSATNRGIPGDNASSADVLRESIGLAEVYGDKVNDVVQDVQLWYKRTNDLASATALTSEALKFQLATGTQLEDTYRTLTGLQAQADDMPMMRGDKNGISLADTPRILQTITSAALAMGAGFHLAAKNGQEMGNQTGNAAEILMQSLDHDTAALKSLGYSFTEAVQLNAALIQAFGNTGSAASEAGDKVQRLVGGIDKMAKAGGLKPFKDEGFDTNKLREALNVGAKGGDVILALANIFEHSNTSQKAFFSEFIAGTRNIDAAEAIFTAYKNNLDQIKKSTNDLGAEDRLAADMSSTFRNEVQKLQAEWDAFLIDVGTQSIPAMSAVLQWVENTFVPGMTKAFDKIVGAWSDVNYDWAMATEPLKQTNLKMQIADYKKSGLDTTELEQKLKDSQDYQSKVRHTYILNHPDITKDTASDYAAESGSGPVHMYNHAAYTRAEWDKLTGDRAERRLPSLGKWSYDYPNAFYGLHPQYMNTAQGIEADTAAKRQMGIAGLAASTNAALAHLHFTHPAANPQGSLAGPDKANTKGILKDYQEQADALKLIEYGIAKVRTEEEASIATDNTAIKSLQARIKTYGNTSEAIQEFARDLKTLRTDTNAEVNTNNAAITQYDKIRDKAFAQADALAKAGKKNTTEWQGFVELAIRANSAADSLITKNTSLTDTLQTQADAYARLKEEKATSDYNDLVKHGDKEQTALENSVGETPSVSRRQRLGSEATQNLLANHQQALDLLTQQFIKGDISLDEYNKRQQTLDDTFATSSERVIKLNADIAKYGKTLDEQVAKEVSLSHQKVTDDNLKMAGFKPDELAHYEAIEKASRAIQDITLKYNEMAKEDPAQAEKWRDAQVAVVEADLALSDYEAHLKKIEDSVAFKATEQALQELNKSIGDTVAQNLFGSDRDTDKHISQFTQEISLLQQQKDAETMLYESKVFHSAMDKAVHDIRMRNYEEEIRKQQELAKQEQSQRSKVGLVQKIGQDLTKSIIDSLMKQMEQNAIKKLFHLDDGSKQLQDSMKKQVAEDQKLIPSQDKHTDAVTKLVPSMDNWSKTADKLATALDKNSAANSKDGNSSSSGPAGILSEILSNGGAALGGGDGSDGEATAAGFNKSGFGKWMATNGQNLTDGVAFLAASYNGYKQGGVGGGLQAGMGMFEGLSSLSSIPGLAALGPAAVPAAIAAAAFTIFRPKLNAQNAPDIYNTDPYGQEMANMGGSGYNGLGPYMANGKPFTEDPNLNQTLGGKGELAYIGQWIAQNPDQAKKILTPQQLQYFSGANGGETYQANGMVQVGGNGQEVYYQDLATAADQATQNIQQFTDALNQATQQTLVSLNAYGTSSGSFPFAWNTPGYEFPAVPVAAGAQSPSNSANNPGQGGSNAVNNPNTGGGGSGNTVQSITVQSNLDGRVLARSTQSYIYRANQAGYSRVT